MGLRGVHVYVCELVRRYINISSYTYIHSRLTNDDDHTLDHTLLQ